MKYFVGVDAGGTKTAVMAVSPGSNVVLQTVTGSSSWREHGIDTVAANVKRAVYELLDGGEIAAITIGMPYYGESAEGDAEMESALDAAFAGTDVCLLNDVEVGWAGSLALEPGINVVAGTGSITFGCDSKGNTARSGGWDEFFSDEGSCFWVGRKVMEIFSKQSDGRLKKGELYNTIKEEFKLENDMDFIDYLHKNYLKSREKVASLQLFAEKAALKGDSIAAGLYKMAAEELALMVKAILSRLDFPEKGVPVSYSGGLFKAGELILEPFSALLKDLGCEITKPKFTPVQGALLACVKKYAPGALEEIKLCLDKIH